MKLAFSLVLSSLCFIVAINVKAGQILSAKQGITLAHGIVNGSKQVLLVKASNDKEIEAVNLSRLFNLNTDLITTYQKLGYNKLQQLALDKELKTQLFPLNSLLSPAGNSSHHIAVGLNYKKHADEVEAKQKPFLFVKATKASREQDIAVNNSELLDYEVELCARPLNTINEHTRDKDINFGFFLCGDFTDRATLLSEMDVDNMQSGRGFSLAKSKMGYFPTGPFLVISHDWQRLSKNIELELTLNGKVRQKANSSQMIWPLKQIIKEAQLYDKDNKPVYNDKAASLAPNRKISSDMVLLTGTPEGVMFQPPSVSFKALFAVKYLFTGQFINNNITDYVVNQYKQQQLAQKSLLQPGDQITLWGKYLGKLDLNIIAANKAVN